MNRTGKEYRLVRFLITLFAVGAFFALLRGFLYEQWWAGFGVVLFMTAAIVLFPLYLGQPKSHS